MKCTTSRGAEAGDKGYNSRELFEWQEWGYKKTPGEKVPRYAESELFSLVFKHIMSLWLHIGRASEWHSNSSSTTLPNLLIGTQESPRIYVKF